MFMGSGVRCLPARLDHQEIEGLDYLLVREGGAVWRRNRNSFAVQPTYCIRMYLHRLTLSTLDLRVRSIARSFP
jgi:hypothetical protein